MTTTPVAGGLNETNIRHRMVDKKIDTLTQLAEQSGIHPSTLSRAIKGERSPSTITILRLMKCLDMTFQDIVTPDVAA